MEKFSKSVEIRWSDLDPNFHLRHSVYYDYGAFVRVSFLETVGLTPAIFMKNNFGPIIFREEGIFKKEIHFGDRLEVTAVLTKSREDFSRWTIAHEVWKNGDTVAAIVTVDGAWIDTVKRKLYQPAQFLIDAFGKIPRVEHFEFEKIK